jgi:putative ABC transport system substrate-binding protein
VIDRRMFLADTGAVLLAAPRVVWAQQARTDSRLVQVGVLGFGSGRQAHVQKAFRESLAELGYVEGQNLEIDQRYANGKREMVPSLLAELLTLRVRVLVVVGPYVLKTTKNAGTDTPIVAIDFESDPVAAGFVKSLARPGGNVTGTFLDQASLAGKWLEFLKDINPKLSRISMIWDSSTPSYQLEALKAGARSIGVQQETLTVTSHDDFKSAFVVASRFRAEAMVILSSPLVSQSGELLANLSATHHLPTVSMFRENVTAGCLMAYGPSLVDGWHRLGSFAGRILRGAKPADLPIERPSTFELIVNLKTAKALGLTIPPSLLGRADEVIQ